MLMTDSVFFHEDGQLQFWVKTDKGKLVAQLPKLGFHDVIRQKLPKIVIERKRERRHALNSLRDSLPISDYNQRTPRQYYDESADSIIGSNRTENLKRPATQEDESTDENESV